jgi:hypothetical protein
MRFAIGVLVFLVVMFGNLIYGAGAYYEGQNEVKGPTLKETKSNLQMVFFGWAIQLVAIVLAIALL